MDYFDIINRTKEWTTIECVSVINKKKMFKIYPLIFVVHDHYLQTSRNIYKSL